MVVTVVVALVVFLVELIVVEVVVVVDAVVKVYVEVVFVVVLIVVVVWVNPRIKEGMFMALTDTEDVAADGDVFDGAAENDDCKHGDEKCGL